MILAHGWWHGPVVIIGLLVLVLAVSGLVSWAIERWR